MPEEFQPREGQELVTLHGWVAVEDLVKESDKIQRALKTVLSVLGDLKEPDVILHGWRFLADAGDEVSMHILKTLEEMKSENED